MTANRSDPWLSATLLVVSIGALGRVLQVGDGILKSGTIPWLAIALAACAAGVLLAGPRSRAVYGRSELIAALVVCLAVQVVQLLSQSPSNAISAPPAEMARFANGIIAAALLCAAVLLGSGIVRHTAFAALLVVHVMLGLWVIRASPLPEIDVFVFQRDAAEALVGGQNPYAMTFENIYGEDPPWYAPGLTQDGRVLFGYPYMPLTLMMAVPGQLAGDYRYALLAAVTLAAALIAYARPSILSFAAAAILLLQPRGMYMLERGWSDGFVVLCLAATVFCAVRLPRAMPLMLGALLASKQYVPLAAGAMLLLVDSPRDWRAAARVLGGASLVAAALTLPFVLWDPAAFWRSAVALQWQQPYRWDSLSFVAWWMGRREIPAALTAVPFAALAATTALVLGRCRPSPYAFAAGIALILLAFFAFNKQAFGNYYYVVIGAMCCAVATTTPER